MRRWNYQFNHGGGSEMQFITVVIIYANVFSKLLWVYKCVSLDIAVNSTRLVYTDVES